VSLRSVARERPAGHRGRVPGHHQQFDAHAIGICDARDLGSEFVIAVAAPFDDRSAVLLYSFERFVHVVDAHTEMAEAELLANRGERDVRWANLVLELDPHAVALAEQAFGVKFVEAQLDSGR